MKEKEDRHRYGVDRKMKGRNEVRKKASKQGNEQEGKRMNSFKIKLFRRAN